MESNTMSILGNILGAIFGGGAPQEQRQPALQRTPTRTPTQANMRTAPKPAGAAPAAPQTQAAAAPAKVDVEAMLDERAAKQKQRLDWRHSIVDLMKILELDSSLSARKELAKELHYTGDMNDSATMNIWLHKQVMAQVAQNGGKVPEQMRN
jgi:hypothetical protein